MQPLLGGTVFGEDNHSPRRPCSLRLDRLMKPVNELAGLTIGSSARGGGPAAHLSEQRPFLRCRFAEERRGCFQGGGLCLFQLIVIVAFLFSLLYLAA